MKKFAWSLPVFALTLLVVLALSWPQQSEKANVDITPSTHERIVHLPTSTPIGERAKPRQLARLPTGFSPLHPQEPGPVIMKVGEFTNAYAHWLSEQPARSFYLGQKRAAQNFLVMLAEVEQIEPKLRGILALGSVGGDFELLDLSQRLTDYMLPRGWAFGVEALPHGPERRLVLTVWLGELIARQTGSVQAVGGERRPYRAYLVKVTSAAQLDSLLGLAITYNSTVLVFPENAIIAAGEVRKIYRKPVRQWDRLDRAKGRQFLGDFKRIADSDQFEQLVAHQILQGTLVHELQHAADYELQRRTAESRRKLNTLVLLRSFGEARAALAAIARGPIPIFNYGAAVHDWAKVDNTVYRGASRIVVKLMGRVDERTSAAELAHRAAAALSKLDELYPAAVANPPNLSAIIALMR